KLRADKGINFPCSKLDIRGLTDKDKKDLAFVVQNADTMSLSFVNRRQDVRDLIAELEKLNAPKDFGIILKIETQSGFNNLAKILLEGMKWYPLGVMIARGDLAIECGWDNIGRVQREILALCRAAHIPDIWATQVLENLSKQGIPSRAELTDAAMAQRTDCVMLNKGPYILQAIKLLDTIFKDMELYQGKNVRLWPAMEKANIH
ncbi:MAG: pyruvate kinase, partial [Eudoraea sp.]|uniref:pyruvate kinase n=1 Tax=Eudoraea sp. TaxID=1979955 RepID=UPI003C76A540